MKQKDIAIIVIAAFIGAVAAYLISNSIFVSPKNRQQQVQVVEPISSSFQQPDNQFFNHSSVDLTQNIAIGQNTNPNPFNNPPSQ